jgi:hypothetical protein
MILYPSAAGNGVGNPTRGAFERAVAAAETAKYWCVRSSQRTRTVNRVFLPRPNASRDSRAALPRSREPATTRLHSVAFSSGSAATSAVVHLLSPGQRILSVDDVYGGTQRYFREIVRPRMGIDVDFVDFSDEDAVASIVSSIAPPPDEGGGRLGGSTGLLWLETPTNPTLRVTDIRAVSAIAERVGAILAVDNTFCSPYFQNPLEHGADVVVHSVTKYINGHSDVVMGVVCTNDEDIYRQLRFTQNGVGAVPSPFDCYLAHRGLKTLHLRMEAAARYVRAGKATDVSFPARRHVPLGIFHSRPPHPPRRRTPLALVSSLPPSANLCRLMPSPHPPHPPRKGMPTRSPCSWSTTRERRGWSTPD